MNKNQPTPEAIKLLLQLIRRTSLPKILKEQRKAKQINQEK